MRRRHRAGAGVALTAVLLVAGCASGDEEPSATESTTTTEGPATSSAGSDAPADDQGGAAAAASAEADTGGEPIVADGSMEVPGFDGGTAVYEVRNLRLTDASSATECPGGSPVNAQRLAADLTAFLVPSQTEDPNVVVDDQPLPIPYVSQLPEIVLVGVGEDSDVDDRWFVGISPVSRLLLSVPNTYLRPAPPGAATTCAVDGWEPTDLAEAVESTEMVALSSAFVPADFDPADYQFRIGRGDDYAYCWPLEDLGTPSELGRCR